MKTVIYMRFITILAALSLALAASPLMDSAGFIADFEQRLKEIWQNR